ncbi:hypothetical protein D3C81_1148290 [compost metagenome]
MRRSSLARRRSKMPSVSVKRLSARRLKMPPRLPKPPRLLLPSRKQQLPHRPRARVLRLARRVLRLPHPLRRVMSAVVRMPSPATSRVVPMVMVATVLVASCTCRHPTGRAVATVTTIPVVARVRVHRRVVAAMISRVAAVAATASNVRRHRWCARSPLARPSPSPIWHRSWP